MLKWKSLIFGIFLVVLFVNLVSASDFIPQGNISITGSGTLSLINGANVTTKKVNIQTTGDRIFINSGSRIIIGLIISMVKYINSLVFTII